MLINKKKDMDQFLIKNYISKIIFFFFTRKFKINIISSSLMKFYIQINQSCIQTKKIERNENMLYFKLKLKLEKKLC